MKSSFMKTLPLLITIAAGCASLARAGTVLTFDGIPTGSPPQFHNARIQDWFGDNAIASGPGMTVTGIGTPDVDLTWSAVSGSANANTRWDYYYYVGPPQPEPWSAGQLNQSWPGDYHDIKFTPANSAKVVVESFNFHGYYGVLVSGGTNFQERFTYNWSVLDGDSLASLVSGSYSFLSDSNKNHPVNINYTGGNGQKLILRLSRVASTLNTGGNPVEVEGDGADIAVDDIAFSEQIGAAYPLVTSVSPADGETNTPATFFYRATIQDGYLGQAVTNLIKLTLDGVILTPTIGKTGLVTTVTFAAGGLIRPASSHQYRLTFADNQPSAVSYTNNANFTVMCNNYEWRFTQGDLSAAVGNGVMDYADSGSASQTAFGTTDGSTVPHINGVPAKYIHVPGFTLDTEGYYLYLTGTGPNVGTNDYINRFTILLDALVPGPFTADYLVPYFNTDPYNLNDADFYLAGDGSIGIGGGGYSAAGTIAPNAWYRVAFVADLLANTLTYYVNGTNVKSRLADGLGGRWSLYSNHDPGPNLLLFNEGDGSGIYTHELYVSSVAFSDRARTAAELASLGGPSANGIFASSLSPRPVLNIRPSGGNVVVSWPTNYVGYALESRASLVSGAWLPVPGVTNNSANLLRSGQPQFYRLAQ